MNATEHKPIGSAAINRLKELLKGNAEDGKPVYMNKKTTVMLDGPGDDNPEDVVINAIRSVPNHY